MNEWPVSCAQDYFAKGIHFSPFAKEKNRASWLESDIGSNHLDLLKAFSNEMAPKDPYF
jgi:hypothetical protein